MPFSSLMLMDVLISPHSFPYLSHPCKAGIENLKQETGWLHSQTIWTYIVPAKRLDTPSQTMWMRKCVWTFAWYCSFFVTEEKSKYLVFYRQRNSWMWGMYKILIFSLKARHHMGFKSIQVTILPSYKNEHFVHPPCFSLQATSQLYVFYSKRLNKSSRRNSGFFFFFRFMKHEVMTFLCQACWPCV